MHGSDWTKWWPSYLVAVKDVCSPGGTRIPGIYGNHSPRGRITVAAQYICIKLWGKGEKGEGKVREEMERSKWEVREKKGDYRDMERVGSVVCVEEGAGIKACGLPPLKLLSLAVQKQQKLVWVYIESIIQLFQQQYWNVSSSTILPPTLLITCIS